MIKAKIDCSKIDKAKLFKGKTKPDGTTPMWLDIVIMETKPTSFGDWRDEQTHIIIQDTSKAERDQGIKGKILGSGIEKGGRPSAKPESPAETTPEEDAAVPF